MELLDANQVHALVSELLQAQEQLHQDGVDHVRANYTRMRISGSKVLLRTSVLGEYVMVARVRKPIELPKLGAARGGTLTGGIG